MTATPILPTVSTIPAAVLRDAVAVAVFAGSARPEHRRTGLPAAPAVGLRVVNTHWLIWAGNGGALAIANRPTDQADTAVLYLDGAELRALDLPVVLRGLRAVIGGNRVELMARGWRGTVRIRRRGPCDPAGAILGALICEQRHCRPPPRRDASSFAGTASWFIPVFSPGDPSMRRVAMTARRICIVAILPPRKT